jgi:hypothetical protein
MKALILFGTLAALPALAAHAQDGVRPRQGVTFGKEPIAVNTGTLLLQYAPVRKVTEMSRRGWLPGRADTGQRLLEQDFLTLVGSPVADGSLNAGTAHTLVVDQLGSKRISLRMDLSFAKLDMRRGFGTEVCGFESRVYHPRTVKTVDHLEAALAAIGTLPASVAAKTAPSTRFVAGVRLTVVTCDEGKRVPLDYTLELSSDGTVIGGEWVSKDRPGFLLVRDPAER